jgi:hypothetical protein
MAGMKKALLLIGVSLIIAVLLSGCLDGDKTIIARYDKDKDAFCILTVWQNIRAEERNGEYDPLADLAYLEKLFNNRDHLLFHPVGSPLFEGILSDHALLRLAGDQYAKVDLSRAGESETKDSPVDLEKITILPGEFFLREPGNLCYYHQVVIPGEVIDAYLKNASGELSQWLANAMADELKRRAFEKFIPDWDRYSKKLLAAVEAGLKSAIADGPEPQNLDGNVPFSDKTLNVIYKAAIGKEIALVREGSVIRVALPTDNEGDDAVRTLKILSDLQSTMRILSKNLKPRDGEGARQAVLYQKMAEVPEFSRDGSNLVLKFDMAGFINAFQSPTDPARPHEKAQIDHAAELAKLAGERLPVNKTLTMKEVSDQFKEGKLGGNPTKPAVKAGEGLEIEKP